MFSFVPNTAKPRTLRNDPMRDSLSRLFHVMSRVRISRWENTQRCQSIRTKKDRVTNPSKQQANRSMVKKKGMTLWLTGCYVTHLSYIFVMCWQRDLKLIRSNNRLEHFIYHFTIDWNISWFSSCNQKGSLYRFYWLVLSNWHHSSYAHETEHIWYSQKSTSPEEHRHKFDSHDLGPFAFGLKLLHLWISNAQVFAIAYEDEKAEEKGHFDQTKWIFFSTDLCKPHQRH